MKIFCNTKTNLTVKTRLMNKVQQFELENSRGARYMEVIEMVSKINNPEDKTPWGPEERRNNRGYYASGMMGDGYLRNPSKIENRYLIRKGNEYFVTNLNEEQKNKVKKSIEIKKDAVLLALTAVSKRLLRMNLCEISDHNSINTPESLKEIIERYEQFEKFYREHLSEELI